MLNQLLSSPALADTAVLINEFGEIGLDHLLVSAVDEDIVLLESGCVCCSVRDDFSAALLRLHEQRAAGNIPAFQRVILETTGIADPIAISELILADPDIARRYACRQILTIVDAVHGRSNLDRHIEAVKQVSVADRIILSKTDLCDQVQLDGVEERLQRLNPLAPRAYCGVKPVDPGILRTDGSADYTPQTSQLPPLGDPGGQAGAAPREQPDAAAHEAAHDHRFATFSLTWPEAVQWEDFVAWLEGLLIVRGDSIHRVKGLLNVLGETQPLVIQGVQHSFYAPVTLTDWPDGKALTRLVFITSDFSKQAAMNSLETILDVTAG